MNETIDDGIQDRVLQTVSGDAKAFLSWQDSIREEGVLPLDVEQTQHAAAALAAVKDKIADYFLRCKLTEYAPDQAAAVSIDPAVLQRLSAEHIQNGNGALSSLPLAAAAAGKPLPLGTGLNPAWHAQVDAFVQAAVVPLLGAKEQLTEADFAAVVRKLTPYQEHLNKKPSSAVASLSLPFLQLIADGNKDEVIKDLTGQAVTIEKERGNVSTLEKLVLLRRDFVKVLKNYISFSDFYEGKGSVFQAGVLYFDSSAADLCFELNNDARHGTLDTLSGAYLVYCDLTRKGAETKKIVALFTNGDSDNIVVGRNGIFYDRAGKDWNAVITKVTANSISVRQAFFMPYKHDRIADRGAGYGR